MPVLQIQGVKKSFKKREVLSSVTFSVNKGDTIGIIGPNGSGKTTLLNLIMGLLEKDSGTISYNGSISAAVSRKGFFESISVEDNLLIFAQLKGQSLSEVKRVSELFCIDFGLVKFGKLSAGMKQRVALAQAFIGNNNLILLDEPTNHLDVDSILNLRSVIENSKKEGASFILTSHVLTELEKVCDRVLFLFNGKVSRVIDVSDSPIHNLEEEYLKLLEKNELP